MTEQTTETQEAEAIETEVQPEQSVYEDIADGLLDEPVAEETEQVEETPEESQPTETYKVKIDGQESEVELDELIAGYQYNKHNTQKAQTLAEKERELAAMEGLANKLKSDPEFAKHVFGYGNEQPPDDDPIEQIKAEAKAEAKEETRKLIEAQNQQALERRIDQLNQELPKDPLYKDTMGELHKHIQALPEQYQKQEALRLHRDPDYFLKMYEQKKSTLKKDQVKPPVLVDSGTTQEVPVETKNKTTRKKMKAEMLKTGDLSNLQEYFKMKGGLADQLL